jgi:ammonium transporter, Amt family
VAAHSSIHPLVSAVAFGIVAGFACRLAVVMKSERLDDTLDIFAVHAVGGFVGNFLTALLAERSLDSPNGRKLEGWIDHHFIQLPWQLLNSAAGGMWAFIMTVSSKIRPRSIWTNFIYNC